jgi:arylsulfatase
MLATLAAAAGEPDIVEKMKKGYKSGTKTFKVHLDGYNLLPFLKGEVKENPRKGFLYWRSDPFERGQEGMFYAKWMADRAFLLVPAQAIVGEFLQTFKEFPPRQRPASFSIDQALEKARQAQASMSTSGGAGVK